MWLRLMSLSTCNMKVLIFISSLDLNSGGPSRSVPMMAKGLAEIGVDVTLMTIRSENMNLHAVEGSNVKIHILERDYSAKEMETFVEQEKFDIIQNQSMWELCYHQLAKIARKHGIPYISTPRGMLEPWSLSQNRWKKKLALTLYQMKDLQHSACIYTTANMEAQHVKELGVKAPCVVIPNGIETDGYPCRTSMDIVKKQVLFLSRIHVKKGIEILIDGWNRIYKDFSDWKLVIVGNGETDYIDALRERIIDAGLNECISIEEPVFGNDKIALYQSSALFVLPSYSENFGMVIAEAMSCGVPVITTKNCPWEVLNETQTGWCIDLSVEELERTLREALGMDAKVLYEKGQKGGELVREQFDYRCVAQNTANVYQDIIRKNHY